MASPSAVLAKSWALSISNIGVVVAVIDSMILTSSAWGLVGLIFIPLNLLVWQYTRKGIMVLGAENHEVQVVFETIKDNSNGDTAGSSRHSVCNRHILSN